MKSAAHRRISRQARARAGDAYGVVQPAKRVDQSDGEGVAAGPHPTTCDALNLGDRAAPAPGHLGHEVDIDRVRRGGPSFTLVVAEARPRGEHKGPGPRGAR